MSEPTVRNGLKTRLATLVFPPLGLVLLWLSPGSLWRKLLGSVFVAVYSLLYVALIIGALKQAGIVHLEWRGKGVPTPTLHPAVPDYDALEQHRSGLAAAPAATNLTGGAYWTGFRGPRRDGHYTERPVRTDWDRQPPRLLWQQPVGGGYASFAIARGLACTLEQRREKEAVVAYDLSTGREVWRDEWEARFYETMGDEGPRTTPAIDGGRVYALGGLGEFRCLDARSGAVLWRHDVLRENQCGPLYFGTSASPLIMDDLVIVLTGDPNGADARAWSPTTKSRASRAGGP